MLNLSKANDTIKKYGNKSDIIYPDNTWYFKIILILLIEVIIIYIKFSQINL